MCICSPHLYLHACVLISVVLFMFLLTGLFSAVLTRNKLFGVEEAVAGRSGKTNQSSKG